MTPNITTYRWLAYGTKAGVTDNDGNGFEYLGSFVYQRDVAGLNLESTSFGAGRFVASSTGEITPFYHLTDHLGSVRAVFTAEFKDVSLGRGTVRRLTTELIAQNDYYPFGLKHENPNLAQHTSNRYLYNGKEEQTTGNVDLLDYGARMYDATLGIWHSVDPLATNYTNYSPYVYCANNPIRMIDPNGMWYTDAAEEEVKRYRRQVSLRIFANDDAIRKLRREQRFAKSNGGINVFDSLISMYEQDNDEMKTIQNELNEMGKSDQGYHIKKANYEGNISGGGRYNHTTGLFEIGLETNDLYMLAHELKHAYQFETGKLSSGHLKSDLKYPTLFYDRSDEVDAYRRGTFFGGDAWSIKDVTNSRTYHQVTTDGPIDFRTIQNENKNGDVDWKQVAFEHKQAFRVNGTTYTY